MGKKEEWKKEQPADFDLSLWPSVFVLLACFSASALSEITRLIMMDQCTNTSLRSKVNPSEAQRSVKTLQNDNTLTLGSVVSWLLDLVELTFIILVQQASEYLNKPAVT